MSYTLESIGGGWVVVDESGRMASALLRTRSSALAALAYLSEDPTVSADALARVNGLERER